MVHLEHRATIADQSHGDSEKAAELVDLLGGMGSQPGLDDGAGKLPVAPPTPHGIEPFVGLEIGPADHGGEVRPLLGGEDAQPDPPVTATHHRRPVALAAGEHRGVAGELPVQGGVVEQTDGHDLDRGDGQIGAPSGAFLPLPAGEGSQGGERTGGPLTDAGAHLQRGASEAPEA